MKRKSSTGFYGVGPSGDVTVESRLLEVQEVQSTELHIYYESKNEV